MKNNSQSVNPTTGQTQPAAKPKDEMLHEKSLLRILIVEDNPLDSDLMTIRLKKDGLEFDWQRVDTETDYLLALNHPPDVILSDWSLPEFSGLRALQILQESGLNVPFIIVTGSIGEEAAVEALHQGANDYLLKDRPERLGQAVRNALQQKKQNEQHQRIEEMQNLLTTALNATANAIVITDIEGTIEWVNPAFSILTGYPSFEAIGKNPRDLVKSGLQPLEFYKQMWETILDGNVWRGELTNRKKDGQLYSEEQTITPVRNSSGQISQFISVKQDITRRKQTEDTFRKLSRVLEQTTEIVFITDLNGVIEYVNPAFESLTGYSKEESLGKTPRILKSGVYSVKEYEALWATILAGNILHGVVTNRKKNGELYHQETTISPLRDGQGKITHFVSTGKDITERMQADEESKNRLAKLEAVNQISVALRAAQNLDQMLPLLLDETLNALHASMGAIWLYDSSKDELRTAVTRGWNVENERPILPEKPGKGINGIVFKTGQPIIASDFHEDLRLPEKVRQRIAPGFGGVVVPIRTGENVIGTFNVIVPLPREITPGEVTLLTTLSEIAGTAIQRTRLHEKTLQDAQRFAALHSIDVAISTSVNLCTTLNILLGQVVDLLNVSAADVLLFNPHTLMLEYSAGKGFRTHAIEKSQLRLGEGYAGRAALERRTVHANKQLSIESGYARNKLLTEEDFVAYFGVPLITKGKVIGVLDIFNRSPLSPDNEWLDFMEALASQAAIAIESSTLFNDLQRSNVELMQAYDTTIEGWSRALDLRDKETEGHTQRVTELAIKLATAFEINGDELAQVRWGALLHDIGKMGVPDDILLKPGALTEDEWVIMKKHPTYAFEMLSPIRYLRAAIDIPYCHHEKWDGTGYPRGLKGEQIPLTARIFAVVDVWDALCSDRPYRAAWPKEKVLAYIQSLSGTHFDPNVVKVCLENGILTN
jgi:PAS domain S-box-containing protein/putative nucleotidyltransferase with HDIG domain